MPNDNRVHLVFLNHGLKTLAPIPFSDLYIDARSCADAARGGYERRESRKDWVSKGVYNVESGIDTGDDKAVQNWVLGRSPKSFTAFQLQIEEAIKRIPSRREEEKDPFAKPFIVCFLCAYGVHRSRAAKHIMARVFAEESYSNLVRKVEVR